MNIATTTLFLLALLFVAGCDTPKPETIPITKADKKCGTAVISIAEKDNKEGVEAGAIRFDFQPAEAEGCCARYGWIQHVLHGEEWHFDNAAWHGGSGGAGTGAQSNPDNATQLTEKDRPASGHWKENPWYGAPTDPSRDLGEFSTNPSPQLKIGDNPGKRAKDNFRTQLICVDTGEVLLTWAWNAESPEKGKKIPPPK